MKRKTQSFAIGTLAWCQITAPHGKVSQRCLVRVSGYQCGFGPEGYIVVYLRGERPPLFCVEDTQGKRYRNTYVVYAQELERLTPVEELVCAHKRRRTRR